MRDLLDHQANAIEYVLHTHEIPGRVSGGALSPRLIHFHLQLPPRVRTARLAPLLPELAAHLEVSAVRLAPDPETHAPVLEVPRPDPVPVRLVPLARKVAPIVPACAATLGLDTLGNPLLLRLDAPEVCPALVVGGSGAGKSALLQTMALGLALHNSPDILRLLLIDLAPPPRRGRAADAWDALAGLPHLVTPPIRGPQEGLLRLRWAERLLDARADRTAGGEAPDDVALVLLVDGLDACPSGAAGRELTALVDRLARDGREAGIYLVGAGRPAGPAAQLAWGARLVGRSRDAAEARVAAGLQGSGAEGLLGDGDFLAVLGGETVRFQAATARPDELARTVDLLQQVAAAESEAPEFSRAAGQGAAPIRSTRTPTPFAL